MYTKVFVVLCVVVVAYASHIGHATSHQNIVRHVSHSAPVQHSAPTHYAEPAHYAAPTHYEAAPVAHGGHDYHAHPKYEFSYSVADGHTGDHKSAQEARDGDAVHGSYSLLQPDGRVRSVHYTADDHNGFIAQVHYSGHAIHPESHNQHY